MAVPALPTNLSNGDVYPESFADSVYDGLEWHRDTKPLFKGRGFTDNGMSGESVSDDTNTTVGFGTGGSFNTSPVINIGSWTTASADADPESLVVPEAGYYRVTVNAEWDADATGYRFMTLLLNGSTVAGADDATTPATASIPARQNLTTLVDLAASDELDVQVKQNSGGALDCVLFLTAEWVLAT